MKENIDKYYLVLIYKINKINHDKIDNTVKINCDANKFKYAIVKKSFINYEDLLSEEDYRVGVDYYHTQVGDLIIDPNFDMIPLNQILNLKKSGMRKSTLLKVARNYIIKLNKEHLNIEQRNIIGILNSDNKSKKLKLGNSIIQYKEEE